MAMPLIALNACAVSDCLSAASPIAIDGYLSHRKRRHHLPPLAALSAIKILQRAALLATLALAHTATGQQLGLELHQERVEIEGICEDIIVLEGDVIPLECSLAVGSRAGIHFRWDSPDERALRLLSSTNDVSPIFSAPAGGGRLARYVFVVYVLDAQGEIVTEVEQIVLVRPFPPEECATAGDVPLKGDLARRCREMQDVDDGPALGASLPPDLFGERAPVSDFGSGELALDLSEKTAEAGPYLRCPLSVTAESGGQMSLACTSGAGDAGLLEYAAEFDWPPFTHTVAMEEGEFEFRVALPDIAASAEIRTIRLTATDPSSGLAASASVQVHLIDQSPEVACEDLIVTEGELASFACAAVSRTGEDLMLQYLPQTRLPDLPWGVFEKSPTFTVPEVSADTTIVVTVRALEPANKRVVERAFSLKIVDAQGPGAKGSLSFVNAPYNPPACEDLREEMGIGERIPWHCENVGSLLEEIRGARIEEYPDAPEIPDPSNALQLFTTPASAILDNEPDERQENGARDMSRLKANSDSSLFDLAEVSVLQIVCVGSANNREVDEGADGQAECEFTGQDSNNNPVPDSNYSWGWTAESGNDSVCPALSLSEDNSDERIVYVSYPVGEVASDTRCGYTLSVVEDVQNSTFSQTQSFDFTIVNIVKPISCGVDNNGRTYEGGAPVNITCSIGNPAPGASYSWSYAAQNMTDPALANRGSGRFRFTPPATITSNTDYTYTISAVNSTNSEAADDDDVTITVLELATFGSVGCPPGSWTVYEGDPDVTVSCSPTTSNGESVSWSWAASGNTANLNQLSGANTATPTFLVPGSIGRDIDYQYSAAVTAVGHEDAAATISFSVLNNQTIALSCGADESTVYPGDPDVTVSCSASGEPGVTDFDWEVEDPGGTTSNPPSGPSWSGLFSVPNTASGVGRYTFRIFASRTGYDPASASVTITVQRRPTITVSCPDDPIEVFVGDPDISLSCSVTNAAGLALDWSWSPSARLSSTSSSSPTFDVPSAGESWNATYSYSVTISNSEAEPTSDSDVLTVNVDQREGLFVSCTDLELYEDEGDLVLDHCRAGGAAEGRSLSFSWSGDYLADASGATPTFRTPEVEQDTEFPIAVTVSDGVTLPASDDFTITVLDRPILALACDGETHTAFEDDADFAIGCEATGVESGITYEWQGPTALLSNPSIATPIFQIAPIFEDETYEFTLTASAENAISAEAGITVNIIANAVLTASCEQYDYQRFEGGENVDFDCSAAGAPEGAVISWEWETAGSTPNLNDLLGVATATPTFVVPASVDRTTVFAYVGTASALHSEDAAVEISVTVLNQGSLIANCEYHNRVNEGSGQVEIMCSASGAPDPGATYGWEWTAVGGTPLESLTGRMSGSPVFAVPDDVLDDTRFEYSATVSADNSDDGQARVVITVLDAKALALPCDGRVYEAYEGDPDLNVGCEATGLREGAGAKYQWTGSQEAVGLLDDDDLGITTFRVPADVAADQRHEYTLTVSAESSVPSTANLTVLVKDSETLLVRCDPAQFSRYEGAAPVTIGCTAEGAPEGARYTWIWQAVGGADIDLLSDRTAAAPTFTIPSSVEQTVVHEYRATVSADNSTDGHVTVRATVLNNATMTLACDGQVYSAFEGDPPLPIGCEAEGGPEADYVYEWTSEVAGNLDKLSDTGIATPEFAVDAEVDADRTYQYSVRVTATGADPLEASLTVMVLDSRPITLTCTNYEFDLYEEAADQQIRCEASGWSENASPTYAWTARGSTADTELLTETDAATTTFLVPDAVDADETFEYRLTVSADHSIPAEADITIRVLNKAQLALLCDPQDHSVFEEEADFTITCSASGAPDPTAAYQFAWTSRGPASHLERLSNAGAATTEFLVPAEVGSDSLFEYTVTASAENSDDAAMDVTVTVRNRPPLIFEESILDQIYVVSEAIVPLRLPPVTGGAPPHSYELAPAPPDGIEFDSGTRMLQGTPRRVMERTPYTWTATDTRGKTATLEFAIEVLEEPPLLGSLTGLTVSTSEMRLGTHLPGTVFSLDPSIEQATSGLAGVVQTGRMVLTASDSVDLDIEFRTPATLRNTAATGTAGRIYITPRATLSASCSSLSSEVIRGSLTQTLLLDGDCHMLRFGGDMDLTDAEPGIYAGNIDVLLREDAAEELYRIPVVVTVENVRRALTIGPGMVRLDDGAADFTSLSETQAMTLYPTVAVMSSDNRQGAFEISNPSLVPLEVSVSAEFGYGAAPVAANNAIMPGEIVTDTTVSDLGDLSEFVSIFPGVVLLNPGESGQVRFEIREEGLPALEQRGHAMLLNFVSRPRQFVNAQELPEVNDSGVTGEVLTQVFGVYVPERAPSQIFVRRVVTPAPPIQDRSVTLVLETADIPFYGDVVLFAGSEEFGRARVLVFTRSQIRVPVGILPTDGVLVRFEPHDGRSAPPVQQLAPVP